MSGPKRLIKNALFAPLRVAPVRSRIAFWMNQENYPELQIQVPLSEGMVCPIISPEYWCSFSEIFVNAEYASAFEAIPLPDRWIDLGCHAGFFSLYVAWRRRKAGMTKATECLLVDADRRVGRAIEALNITNQLDLKFLYGGVGSSDGTMKFSERAFMASSATEVDGVNGTISEVPTVTEKAIREAVPGPYDLIKVDIEGSEHELLENYGGLIKQTKHLILEWHSWHRGGGGKKQLISQADALGFQVRAEVRPDHQVSAGKSCGVLLFENAR